jgi:hypothetical protein
MIDQWKRLAAEKRKIESGMRACLQTFVGKVMRYQFSNMVRPADGEIISFSMDGERIKVRNISTGKTRMISIHSILPKRKF